MEKDIKHLVVDSSAFIKNSPINEYAENIYTVNGVVKEIRDKATLERLQVLPYQLNIKEPLPEAIKFVSEFAKKTGDYASLSVVDLQLAALTYQLHKEHSPSESTRSEPKLQVTGKIAERVTLPGFYYPKEKPKKVDIDNEEKENEEKETEEDAENWENEDDESDNEEAWITAHDLDANIKDLSLDNNSKTVACITSDFTIQNLLLQIGLHVVSVDGLIVKNSRVFILRCYSCFTTTNDVTKLFCSNCGNKTLKRVSVSVNEDGTKNIHINFKRPINIRGTRFSLPLPKGGKHAHNPIVCEDQPLPRNKPPKSHIMDAMSSDYDAGSSPFSVNDIYSRAASLGIRRGKVSQYSRRNPDDWFVKRGNKKKR